MTANNSRNRRERQTLVLRAVYDSISADGYPPSLREVAKSVGLASPSSVKHHLDELESLGFIRRYPNRPRALEVTDQGLEALGIFGVERDGSRRSPAPGPEQGAPSGEAVVHVITDESQIPADSEGIYASPAEYIPLVGRIAAGGPILAEQHIEDVFPLPRELTGDGELFMLTVCGESMVDAAICDGDLVVVRRQPTANNGEIVAAMIDGEATVKVYSRRDGHVWLLPRNENYAPIPGDRSVILGKVVTVIRSLT